MATTLHGNRNRRRRFIVTVAAIVTPLVTAAAIVYAHTAAKLVINGNPVSTDIRKIDGKNYVPIEDVAKALNMQVFVSSGQYVLRPAGGANQVAGKRTGKIGEELFTGQYRFLVKSIQEANKYHMKYANKFTYNKDVEAAEGEKLVILDCQLKNGTTKKDEFAFSKKDFGGNTALADADGRSYEVDAYDVFADEDAPLGANALPGAAVPFAMVFRIPNSAKAQDLVYTIVRYVERANNKGTDVRVSLQK